LIFEEHYHAKKAQYRQKYRFGLVKIFLKLFFAKAKNDDAGRSRYFSDWYFQRF